MTNALAFWGIAYGLTAAVWALMGTNAQARLTKRRLFENEDPQIASVARLWRPGPRWLHRPAHRKAFAAFEAHVREDDERWSRYTRLRDELRAWNLIESSVVMAAAAALFGAIVFLLSR